MARTCRLLWASVLGFGFLTSGCSTKDDVAGEVFEAMGVVRLDGKPLANATVRFVPLVDTRGSGAMGQTDEKGSFTLEKRYGTKGIEAGKYKCVISKIAKPDGTHFPPDTPAEVRGMEGREQVPPRYSDEFQSQLTLEVPKGGKKFEIDLSSKNPTSASVDPAGAPK